MSSGLRSFLAIVLSMGVLILWYTFIAPPPTPTPSPERVSVQETAPRQESGVGPSATSPSTVPLRNIPRKGEAIYLENNLLKLAIHPLGGVVADWELKKFTRNGGGKEPSQELVSLVEVEGAPLETPLSLDEGKTLLTPEYKVLEKGPLQLQLGWNTNHLAIFKRFRLKPDSYQVDVELEIQNQKGQTIHFVPSVVWGKQAVEESPQRGVLFFKTPPDRWQPVHLQGGQLTEILWEKVPNLETRNGDFAWVGAQSRYFFGGVIPTGKKGNQLELGQFQVSEGEKFFYQKLILPAVQVLPGERWSQNFLVYGGPKEYHHLKTIGLEKTLGLGWTTVVAIPILYALQLFYKLIHNYGVAIILLTVLIKILLNPINRKSLQSMKGMQALQPRLKELREKYGKDKEKLNMEMMQLFKAHKINPMGGCLPMLLQIPIYIALYKVLWSSVELYHAPFFWFYQDLSAPDPYLITPLLLGVTMFFQTKMTPTASVDPAQQKMMMLMPLMFCVFMVFLPMGLGLYILVNTLMTILQQQMYQKNIRMRDVVSGRVFRS